MINDNLNKEKKRKKEEESHREIGGRHRRHRARW